MFEIIFVFLDVIFGEMMVLFVVGIWRGVYFIGRREGGDYEFVFGYG